MQQKSYFIAGNWKMNPVPDGAFDEDSPFRAHAKVDVAVFATYLDLSACVQANLPTGAQYGRVESTGAYTGDISLQMLKDIGCSAVLCGHSERRLYHSESNTDVAEQAKQALQVGLRPVVCVGETAEQREAGQAKKVVQEQVESVLQTCTNWQADTCTFAYEPVWAIGTGNTATPDLAQEMHAYIRSLFPENIRHTRLLYGGSMKPENAADLLGQLDIDGGLIGGASLQKEQFAEIVNIASNMA